MQRKLLVGITQSKANSERPQRSEALVTDGTYLLDSGRGALFLDARLKGTQAAVDLCLTARDGAG
jgi:hypothetical protein